MNILDAKVTIHKSRVITSCFSGSLVQHQEVSDRHTPADSGRAAEFGMLQGRLANHLSHSVYSTPMIYFIKAGAAAVVALHV